MKTTKLHTFEDVLTKGITIENENGEETLVAEVMQHLGNDTVRCVAMSATEKAAVKAKIDDYLAKFKSGEKMSAYEWQPCATSDQEYKILFSGMIIVGTTVSLEVVWNLADTFNGLMAIPNFIALFALSFNVFK